MVNWYWKEEKGVFYMENKHTGKTDKVGLYGGNCLGSLIYRFNENGQKMYNFINWFNDLKAFEWWVNDLVENGNLKELKKVKLNAYYKDYYKMVNILVKNGVKVEIYYKK